MTPTSPPALVVMAPTGSAAATPEVTTQDTSLLDVVAAAIFAFVCALARVEAELPIRSAADFRF